MPGPYQKKNQIWRKSKQGNVSQFSIHMQWHKDLWVLPLPYIVQKMDPDWWPIISLFVYSSPRPSFLFTQIPSVLHQTIFQSPAQRELSKNLLGTVSSNKNLYLGTLTISRVVTFEQNSLQKYLQNDCDPFAAPLLSLGGVAASGVWPWVSQQSPNWDFCLTHGLLSSLIRWLLSKETSKPPGRSPSNSRVSFFWHIRWPLAENVRDQRSLQCPGSIYMLEKVPGCPCVSQCYCSYVKPRIWLSKTVYVFSLLYMSHTCSAF